MTLPSKMVEAAATALFPGYAKAREYEAIRALESAGIPQAIACVEAARDLILADDYNKTAMFETDAVIDMGSRMDRLRSTLAAYDALGFDK